jgi:hypothetical protein
VCFAGASALCLPLLPAGNSNLCGGRTCYVPDRAVLSDAASVGRTSARWNGIATPFRAEGMLGKNAPHLPAAGWLVGWMSTASMETSHQFTRLHFLAHTAMGGCLKGQLCTMGMLLRSILKVRCWPC